LSTHERQLTFTPRYTGTDGQPITFQIVNETLPTTSLVAQPVSLKLYTDNPVIYLKASQSGAEATYAYHWQAVCSTGNTPDNVAPVLVNPIPSLAATAGSPFNFLIPANTFDDPNGDPLSLTASGLPAGLSFTANVINGTPAVAGVYSVTIQASDGHGLTATSSFTLTVNPPSTAPFGFAGITEASCQVLSTHERQLTFTPRYTGT
ncbi:putative Ig domain-containing protein, partial [Spirosoma luteolum]